MAAEDDVTRESSKELEKTQEEFEEEVGGTKNKWLRRCSKCNRQVFFHDEKVNNKCDLEKLEFKSEELKEEDKKINEKRFESKEREEATTKTEEKRETSAEKEKSRSKTKSKERSRSKTPKKQKSRDKSPTRGKSRSKTPRNRRRSRSKSRRKRSKSRSTRRYRGRDTYQERRKEERYRRFESNRRDYRERSRSRSVVSIDRSYRERSHNNRSSQARNSRGQQDRRSHSIMNQNPPRSFEEQQLELTRMMMRMMEKERSPSERPDRIMEVPKWSKGMSVESWKRSVLQWDKTCRNAMKKYLKLTEYLKTETEHDDLKQFVIDNVIESGEIAEDDPYCVEKIIAKIVDFADETIWKKTGDCVEEFLTFEKSSKETMKQFVTRFEAMVTRMKNSKVQISPMFLANFLLKKSKLSKIEKKAVLSKTNLEEETLKTLKNALKDLCSDDEKNNESEVNQTLYGGYTPGKRNGSRSRNGKFAERNRSSSRGRSFSTNRFRTTSYDEFLKWKKNQSQQYQHQSPSKRIYKCQVFKMDLKENLFDQETVNLGIVDSGCPEAYLI